MVLPAEYDAAVAAFWRRAGEGIRLSIISALQILYHKSKRAAFVSGLAARGAAVPPFGGKMFTRGKSLIFEGGPAAPARSTAPPWGYYTMNAQREWYNCPSRRSAAWGHLAGIIIALRLLYHERGKMKTAGTSRPLKAYPT